jgi:ribonuclease HIII
MTATLIALHCIVLQEPSGLLAHAAQQGRVSAVASILSCEAFVNLPSETMEQAMDVAFQVATNDEVKYQIQELVRVMQSWWWHASVTAYFSAL